MSIIFMCNIMYSIHCTGFWFYLVDTNVWLLSLKYHIVFIKAFRFLGCLSLVDVSFWLLSSICCAIFIKKRSNFCLYRLRLKNSIIDIDIPYHFHFIRFQLLVIDIDILYYIIFANTFWFLILLIDVNFTVLSRCASCNWMVPI